MQDHITALNFLLLKKVDSQYVSGGQHRLSYTYIHIYSTYTHTHIYVCIHIYVYIYFQIIFPYRLLQDID